MSERVGGLYLGEGTLAGVAVNITPLTTAGFRAKAVVIANDHGTNSYTLTIGGFSVRIRAKEQFKFVGDVSTFSLNGTGFYRLVCFEEVPANFDTGWVKPVGDGVEGGAAFDALQLASWGAPGAEAANARTTRLTVTDPSGAPLDSAKVRIKARDTLNADAVSTNIDLSDGGNGSIDQGAGTGVIEATTDASGLLDITATDASGVLAGTVYLEAEACVGGRAMTPARVAVTFA